MIRVIFLGPPGAGKGTQADILARHTGATKVATGDILREAVARRTELGKIAEGYMKRGELVPDDIMLGIVEETLKELPDGFILDGFPRTLPQAQGLDQVLEKLGVHLDAVVSLVVPDEEIVRRLSARRVCPKCQATYNLLTQPPKEDEICDQCGTPLVRRPDDEPQTIRRRLEVYRAQTEPLIGYYRGKGLLVEVDGVGPTDEVARRIRAALGLRSR